MLEEFLEMNIRSMVLLFFSALWLACARGRVTSQQASPPIAAQPQPTTAPASTVGPSPTPPPPRIDFETQIRPLLQEKCSPCHFPGGRMYDRLPFDREETIRVLGLSLNTRLKDPVDIDLLRTFLEQKDEKTGTDARH
jgi:hypothetical protein